MEVIYGLIPGMIFLGLIMVVLFFWAVRSGQFDDFEGASNRILMDDDDPLFSGQPGSKEADDRGKSEHQDTET